MNKIRLAVGLLACVSCALQAQDSGGEEKVQIHGFVAQGFMFSSHNNYLSANTNDGSPKWTEGAINFSATVTEKLRAGMQVHTYRLGALGQQKLELDWAYGDYKLDERIGFRAGKVKIPLGLFNDTQDIDAVHLWALLPQGVYPIDNKSTNLAHIGAEAYGKFALAQGWGSLSYRVYGGNRNLDPDGGYYLASSEKGSAFGKEVGGNIYGADLRWRTPMKGMVLGASRSISKLEGPMSVTGVPIPLRISIPSAATSALYGEYERGKFYAAAEYRRTQLTSEVQPIRQFSPYDVHAWFLMGSYRATSKVTVGVYNSHYTNHALDQNDFHNYQRDWAVTTRFDANQYLYLKLEGHMLDGTGIGFYQTTNPQGLDPRTNLFVTRVGFTF